MSETPESQSSADALIDQAVAEGGAYDVIRKRLIEQGKQLETLTQGINQARLAEFGSSDMRVIGRTRVRTENNCVARDIVQVGSQLLFGYNVFIGLKKETKVDDVFALFEINEDDENLDISPVDISQSFLAESSFVNDFDELYRYYKDTKLIQLTMNNGKLLAAFQIGERVDDVRVFRWSVSPDGQTVKYIDNRGERDIQLPPSFDFEWTATTREDNVNGRHPHVNILDTLFVETIGGDLTIKLENNTELGLGVYTEPVEDKTQSLDDADIHFARVGGLILLKVRPYREELWRHFIFNTLSEDILRVDAIGQACVQLPEDHGIIFPGGYYLQTGEYKQFDAQVAGLRFKRKIRSPNGEDMLYVFYEPNDGVVGLFAYNIIKKELQNPIYGHGYALADDGRLVIFSAENDPTRIHPMQIWHTPYFTAEFASQAPTKQTFYGRIGNAELVRGISDLFAIGRLINNQSVSSKLYEALSQSAQKIFDDHYWIESSETSDIAQTVSAITDTSELVIDEFEKVESIRQQSAKAMQEAEQKQTALLQTIRPDNWETAESYVDALSQLRRQRGHLVTIRDHRYIDQSRIDQLAAELQRVEETVNEQTVIYLSKEEALEPYLTKIDGLDKEVQAAETNAVLQPLIETIESTATGLDLLSELMGTLKVDDATVRTRIIDAISSVYSRLNQSKATAKHKQKNVGSAEAIAQFGAQFKLFSQSIANALSSANTPEKCEEQLSRLLIQLEELESQYSQYDQFLSDIMDKREEIYESFEGHKQQLLDERQRKAQSLTDAASRMLTSIEKRALKFTEADELNTYFASDALVMKVRELIEQLRALDNAIKADDIESKFKANKEQALRSLRDKSDIFEAGGNIIKLGPRHRFSVNTQELDLTLILRKNALNIHLTGTDYYEPIQDESLNALRDYWDLALESETGQVYRAEYLASSMLQAASLREHGLSTEILQAAMLDDDALSKLVREFASPRYKEGYVKGVHDHDAALLLSALVPAIERADLLTFDPRCRALAQIIWANLQQASINVTADPGLRSHERNSRESISHSTWPERAQSAHQMSTLFKSESALTLLSEEVETAFKRFCSQHPMPFSDLEIRRAAVYLVAELSQPTAAFITSKYAMRLVSELKQAMNNDAWRQYALSLTKLNGWPAQRWGLSEAWLNSLVEGKANELEGMARYIPEAVAIINVESRLDRRETEVDLELEVEGLLGDHVRISGQTLRFSLDDFLQRLEQHRSEVIPAYHNYLQVRQSIIARERDALRLHEFKARPLSSFVRNRLINESYLPLIGDNLAKQMGTVGENKRSDLMGLLMMISPPGYGKTTLMEYVANRLGLIFMKINCPSLGHDVLSLDPAQAPNATARKELEKLNLGLEMGSNVMLYLDDIQHTHPEFLQKFISLCDGTRRVDGVWKGQTKTYDMRGRKFCVVMAGNPYTESGEAFKIPDMLANRADIYNLGDILGGMDEQFALSYVENSLTSNPVLAPLAVREMSDIYKLIDMAKGAQVATTDLSYAYSAAELNEMTDILKKMLKIQDVLLKINQQYIASAAQDDNYRTEPSFKLQGSYRNMNKLTEKVTAVMNDAELQQLIADHYLGEAQMLTTGAEANLLKLGELREVLDEEQAERWAAIKKDFLRNKAMGGDDSDVGGKVVAQLADLVNSVQQIGAQPRSEPTINVMNQPLPELEGALRALAEALENSVLPMVNQGDKRMKVDLFTYDKIRDISDQLRAIQGRFDDEGTQ